MVYLSGFINEHLLILLMILERSADTVEALFWHYNDVVCRGEMHSKC